MITRSRETIGEMTFNKMTTTTTATGGKLYLYTAILLIVSINSFAHAGDNIKQTSNRTEDTTTNQPNLNLLLGAELPSEQDAPILLFDGLTNESGQADAETQTGNSLPTIETTTTTTEATTGIASSQTTATPALSPLLTTTTHNIHENTTSIEIEDGDELETEETPPAEQTIKFEPPRNVSQYMDYMEHLFHDFRHQLASLFEPHVPNLLRTIQKVLLSNGCSYDMLRLAMALRQFEPWALRMIDSSGKLPEGIFEGSFTALGSYDECLNTQFKTSDQLEAASGDTTTDQLQHQHLTRGKYCLVNVSPYLPPKPPGDNVESVFQEEAARRNYTNNDQMAQISPMFYYMKFRIGVCIPSTCTNADMDSISEALSSTLRLNITIPSCQIKQTMPLTRHQLIGGVVFGLVLALVVCTTLIDYFGYSKKRLAPKGNNQKVTIVLIRMPNNQQSAPASLKLSPPLGDFETLESHNNNLPSNGSVWKCFSIISNFKQNFTNWEKRRQQQGQQQVAPRASRDSLGLVSCLDGIRVISLCWVIVANSYITLDPRATKRLSRTREVPKYFLFQLVAQASLAIETFFFLSGLLMALSFYRRLSVHGPKSSGQKSSSNNTNNNNTNPIRHKLNTISNWLYFYLHRYVRMTPATMLVIAFTMFAFRFGDGPLWMEATQRAHMSCSENWWRHLVHLANFIDTRQMCFIHFWYIAADMQLFLFAPILLYLIYKSKALGYLLASLIGLSSVAWIFYTTYERKLPPTLLFYNSDPDSRREFGNAIMTKPLTHALPYLVGMLLGRWLVTKTRSSKATETAASAPTASYNTSNLNISRYIPIKKPLLFKLCALLAAAVAFGEIFIPYRWNNSNLPSRLMASLYASVFRFGWSLALAYLVLLCRHRRSHMCQNNSSGSKSDRCENCNTNESISRQGSTLATPSSSPSPSSTSTLTSTTQARRHIDRRAAETMCFCSSGGNLLNRLLSLHLFTHLSKLSFVAYLIHLPLMSVFVAQTRGLFAFSHLLVVHLALSYLLMTFIFSFLLVHIIEFPFVSLGAYLFERMQLVHQSDTDKAKAGASPSATGQDLEMSSKH